MAKITREEANYLFASYNNVSTDLVKKFLDFVFGISPFKEYVANLSQALNTAPVATVLNNSLSGAIVWSYVGAGSYHGTLTGAFPAGSWMIIANTANSTVNSVSRIDDNTILVDTNGNDSVLNNTSIWIRVLNS